MYTKRFSEEAGRKVTTDIKTTDGVIHVLSADRPTQFNVLFDTPIEPGTFESIREAEETLYPEYISFEDNAVEMFLTARDPKEWAETPETLRGAYDKLTQIWSHGRTGNVENVSMDVNERTISLAYSGNAYAGTIERVFHHIPEFRLHSVIGKRVAFKRQPEHFPG